MTAQTAKPSVALQLALDVLSVHEALRAAEPTAAHVQILEVGTPLVIEAGVKAVRTLKRAYPTHQVVADLKIMDAGRIEALSAFSAGADIVTVLGLASDATIKGAAWAARHTGGLLMADMVNVPDPTQRGRELLELGVHILCLHTAYDRQQENVDPLDELRAVRPAVAGRLAIAGGLKLTHVHEAVHAGADVLVVGGGILNEPDPGAAAAAIADALAQAQESKP